MAHYHCNNARHLAQTRDIDDLVVMSGTMHLDQRILIDEALLSAAF
jgi:hypothetical protein